MARLPDPTTALGRRPTPSLTRPVAGFRPDFSGAQALAQGADAVADELNRQADKSARMDALKKLTEFQRKQTEAYAEHYANISENPGAHTDTFMQGYDAAAQEALGSVDPRAREWFETNLVQTRQQMWGEAFGNQRKAFAASEIADYEDAVANAAAMNTLDPAIFAQAKQNIIDASRGLTNVDPIKREELRRNAMFTLDKSLLMRKVDNGGASEVLGWMRGNDERWRNFPIQDRADVRKYAETQDAEDIRRAFDAAVEAGDLDTAARIRETAPSHVTPATRRSMRSSIENEAKYLWSSTRPSPIASTAQEMVLADIEASAAKYPDIRPEVFVTVASIETSLGTDLGSRGNVFQQSEDQVALVGGDTVAHGMESFARRYRAAKKIAEKHNVEFEDWMGYLAHQQGEGGLDAMLSVAPTRKAADALVEKTSDKNYQGPKGRDNAVAQLRNNSNGSLIDPTVEQYMSYWKNKYESRAGDVPVVGAPTSEDVKTAATVPASAFEVVPDTFEAWDRQQRVGPKAKVYQYLSTPAQHAAYKDARDRYADEKKVLDTKRRLETAWMEQRAATQEDTDDTYERIIESSATPEQKAVQTQALIAMSRRLPEAVADEYSSRLLGSSQDAAAAVQELAQMRAEDIVVTSGGKGGLSNDAFAAFSVMDRALKNNQSMETAVAIRDKTIESGRDKTTVDMRRSDFRKKNSAGEYVNQTQYVDALEASGLTEQQARDAFELLRPFAEDVYLAYGEPGLVNSLLTKTAAEMHIAPATYGNRARAYAESPGEPRVVRREMAAVVRDREAKGPYKLVPGDSRDMLYDYMMNTFAPQLPGGAEKYAAYLEAKAARDDALRRGIAVTRGVSVAFDDAEQALRDYLNLFDYEPVDDPEERGRTIYRVTRAGDMKPIMVDVGAELGGTGVLYADPRVEEAPNFMQKLRERQLDAATEALSAVEQQNRRQRASLGAQMIPPTVDGYSLVTLGDGKYATTATGVPLMENEAGDLQVIPQETLPVTVVDGESERVVWVNFPALNAEGALTPEEAARRWAASGQRMVSPLTGLPYKYFSNEAAARSSIAADADAITPSVRGQIEASRQVLRPEQESQRNPPPPPEPRQKPDWVQPRNWRMFSVPPTRMPGQ